MNDPEHPNGSHSAIPVRSKRLAMDWSLVLASQGISAIINKGEGGWELQVDHADGQRARSVLREYEIENSGWRWQPEWLGAGVIFHWGAWLWVLGIVGMYYWSMVRFPWLKSDGMVDSRAVMHGQWWRVFTAVTLHENLSHLLSNAGIGFLLLGLAMARFGPAVAVLAAFLAGVAGKCAGVLLRPDDFYGLGSSGMVTGALGLITMQSFAPWRKFRMTMPVLPRAIAAGVLILVLIGFSPGSDQLAHVGGFLAGVAFGLTLGWVRPAVLQSTAVNVVAGIVLGALILVTWLMASRG